MLKFSITYHPQTKGQHNVINNGLRLRLMSLGDLIRCLVGDPLILDKVLPMVEFMYDSSINHSNRLRPYTGYLLKKPIDLISPPCI